MSAAELALSRKVSRRQMLTETAAAVAGTSILLNIPMINFSFFRFAPIRPEILGGTFSQLQCSPGYLDLDYRQAFKEFCDLHPDIVRLPTYWNEIESKIGFSKTDWLMDEAAKRNLPVILTVGAKAPRYPELHLPSNISMDLQISQHPGQKVGEDPKTFGYVLDHVEKVVDHYKDHPTLRFWQVENEPLDFLDFAGNHSIDEKLLQAEFEMVNNRKRPDQQILLSNAFNIPSAKNSLLKSLSLKPAGTGFNVYPKVPRKDGGYHQLSWGDYQDLGRNAEFIRSAGIDPWIFEVQAEPWEDGRHVHYGDATYPSSSPEQTIRLVSDLTKKGFNKQLLWGVEFWIKQKNLGFPDYLEAMRKLYLAA